jgi:phage tail P2-like protein
MVMTPALAVAAVAPIASAMLPPLASGKERAFLTAELARLVLVDPRVIATIWNPWTCPTVLLPWLAYGVSVDVWSHDWTEDQKRKVIAASPMVHRLKGTLGAVRRALAAFDLETRIIEWWEVDERRGTFRVEIIYRNGSAVFSVKTHQLAASVVRAAKPKSRVPSIRSVALAEARLNAAACARSVLTVVAHPYYFDPPTLTAGVFVAATPAGFFTATAHHEGMIFVLGWTDDEGNVIVADDGERMGFYEG